MAGSTASRAFRRLTGDDWTFDPLGAAARVPAIVVMLALGAATGHRLDGVLAAGGAFAVGFGAYVDLHGSKPRLLVAASFAIGVSAVVGSLAAGRDVTMVLVGAVFGAAYGLATPRDAGEAWLALRCALAAIIATSYPASLTGAAARAVPIVAGGLVQAVVVSVTRFARGATPSPPADPVAPRYALHLAIALSVAIAAERALALRNGYWVPMTALLVLRPDTRHTMARAFARVAGTIGGAAIASAVILSMHPGRTVLALLVALAALGAYVFQRATYGLLSACATAYVVFILSLVGLAEKEVAESRIAATALGGAIALAVQSVDDVRRRVRKAV